MEINKFEEYCFVLAHYPKLTIEEKWSLLCEQFVLNGLTNYEVRIEKKLSAQKKASFLEFIKGFDSQSEKERIVEAGAHWVTVVNETYPSKLKEIYLPPLVLFYKGDFDLIYEEIVAIVGARECSNYGRACVHSIVPTLTAHNIVIASGLAKGLDAEVHQSTIDSGGKTIAVIGTGLDRSYPSTNKEIQENIETDHLLLSEFPMGTKPFRHHFPLRNRIISGISRGVIVAEAKKRSGSLITAYQALEQNREVYAIPGSIFDPLSEGTNELIKSGAKMVTSTADIMEDFLIVNSKI